PIKNWQLKIGNARLSLRELEALARALLSVLLTFFDARIARHQSGPLQRGPQLVVVFNQRARNAVTNRACLSRGSAAGNIHYYVELARRLSQVQRLANDHSQRLVRKIRFERLPVDLNAAATRPQINSSGRCFSTARSVVLNLCHVLNPFSLIFEICGKGSLGSPVAAPRGDARRQHRLLTSWPSPAQVSSWATFLSRRVRLLARGAWQTFRLLKSRAVRPDTMCDGDRLCLSPSIP